MKRIAIIAIAASLTITSFADAQNARRQSVGRKALVQNPRPVRKEKLHPVRALLLKRVDRVQWEEQPLIDVVDWLKSQSPEDQPVNIVVKWRALEIESIDQDSVITLDLQETTVAQVLDEVLDQLSDLDPLRYRAIDNKLKISTLSDFDRQLFVRVYNIQDIMFEVRNFFGSPQIDLNQQQQGGGGGGGQGGQQQIESIFGQGGGGGNQQDNQQDDGQDEERAEQVMEWIRLVVAPDTWQENGGLGTMDVYNQQLIVRNSLSVHEILGGPFRFDE